MHSSATRAGGPPRALSGARFSCRSRTPDRLFLPGIRLLDPAAGIDRTADLLVAEGRIASHDATRSDAGDARIADELSGCTVVPGFVDAHVHMRTPGYEYKEDVASATSAAAAGGYVLIVGMANTHPVVDTGAVAASVLEEASRVGLVRVGQVGAVTRGLAGEELAELWDMHRVGVAGFSDDGRSVEDPTVLLHALRYLRGSDRPLLLHVDAPRLVDGGAMHEGRWSARLGLRGIPSLAETSALLETLDVVSYASEEARRQGAQPVRVHVQHLSSSRAVEIIEEARQAGMPVTAEVTPHHLCLTDQAVRHLDPNLKMNPPLRGDEDRDALVHGLADGTITAVATDHAPHAPHEKEVPFARAPFGTVGLESAFPALFVSLVEKGTLSLERLVEAMSTGPSQVLGIPAPSLSLEAPADFCVLDLEESWTFSERNLAGKSRNSAFLGSEVKGRVEMTVAGGEIVWDAAAGTGPEETA